MKIKISPKAIIAEFVGTFALALVVLLSINNSTFPVETPILAALTLSIFVYTLGHISGTHINPAVTLGQLAIKKIDLAKALYYLGAQFLGSLFALLIANYLVGDSAQLSANPESTFLVGFAEFMGMLIFTFGISAVVYEKVPSSFSGVVIGSSLLLGISIAAITSNGVLNPAVALSIGSFNWSYLLGPILGAVFGFNLGRYFFNSK